MPYTYTPLRYPGGKTSLAGFLRDVIKANHLSNPVYVEPYCGGAGAALHLLFSDVVSDIFLNDIDPAVQSFWSCCVKDPEGLCDRVAGVRLTVREWDRQRRILESATSHAVSDVAFAALFLNRVNRSGILRGGLIGGRQQQGTWKMGARFNRDGLIAKVRHIGRNAHRLHVSRMDAADFLRDVVVKLEGPVFLYLDPPYVEKGGSLYQNHYSEADHAGIARLLMSEMPHPWVASYDYCALVKRLYRGLKQLPYTLNYSASQGRRRGRELVILGPGVKMSRGSSPATARRTCIKLARTPAVRIARRSVRTTR
jgi:DNA adenine methylase